MDQFPPSSPPEASASASTRQKLPRHEFDIGRLHQKLMATSNSLQPVDGLGLSSQKSGLLPAFVPTDVIDKSKSIGKGYDRLPIKIHEDTGPFSPSAKASSNNIDQARMFYPTPDPSSTIGDRSSSPGRQKIAVSRNNEPSSPVKRNRDSSTDLLKSKKSANSSASNYPTFAPSHAQEQSFTIRSPLSAVALVRLPTSGKTVTIGRSSQSCDVALSRKNKLVSRVHASVRYTASTNTLSMECLGWNGLTVVVPFYDKKVDQQTLHDGYPTATGTSDYEVPKGHGVEVDYVPGITIDIRGERALLEIVDDDVNDDTEDESVAGSQVNTKSSTPQPESSLQSIDHHTLENVMQVESNDKQLNTDASNNNALPALPEQENQPSTPDCPNTPSRNAEFSVEAAQVATPPAASENDQVSRQLPPSSPHFAGSTPSISMLSSPVRERERLVHEDMPLVEEEEEEEQEVEEQEEHLETTSDQVTTPKTAETLNETIAAVHTVPSENTVSQKEVVTSRSSSEQPEIPKHLHSKPTLAPTASSTPSTPRPLSDSVSLNIKTERLDSLSPQTNSRFKRAASEEPSKKRKKVKQEDESDQDLELGAEEIQKISHLVANNLAFSRLSSTPISTLRKALGVLSSVPKSKLRDILSNIKCVGVIQRSGKDAAGKPLEEEYYYLPENDDDEHRRLMLEQSRGHGGLRSCRRQHKQVSNPSHPPLKTILTKTVLLEETFGQVDNTPG
ncbi:Tos4p [Sugiyamaella lignohabitans]|uniref:Tos4p n=1 Tax=Sugiyamaella lignohabitans TaxID=796027 RepID=A0A167DQX4_9ASCO|nr:Tos4p [Sugiyamaella lignohabitans]ANB13185.1 Tos4p [Sugiyamaella lignohabitans]